MITRAKIATSLDIQEQHEGKTGNIALCRAILSAVKDSSEWIAATSVQHHRYGVLSYECHRFYYVKPWLTTLLAQR